MEGTPLRVFDVLVTAVLSAEHGDSSHSATSTSCPCRWARDTGMRASWYLRILTEPWVQEGLGLVIATGRVFSLREP